MHRQVAQSVGQSEEHHRTKYWQFLFFILGHVYGNFMKIRGLKAPGNYFASLELFDLLGAPENIHFYDFGISGRVQTPQYQLFLSSGTPGRRNKSRTNLGIV